MSQSAKPKRRPNIFDLEKVTGVSRGTISRAFNNSTEINGETRDMIFRKAAEIGYSPHPGARTMRLGRTARWGLLIPYLQNPWYAEITEALDHEASRHNTMLLLGMTHYRPELESAYIQYWASGETDGIIVTSSDNDINSDVYAKIHARDFPLVFLYASPANKFDYVRSEETASHEAALQCLYDAGHRHIGYLSQNFPHARSTPAFLAYLEFLKNHGLPFREEYVHLGTYDYVTAEEAWKKWNEIGRRPTGVICCSDVIACSLVQQARHQGLQVPADLSIIGQNDTAEAARLDLTTIRTDKTAFALAVSDLIKRPRGENMPSVAVRTVGSELIYRDSVAPPKNR
jgi:LacI family transcriptional regulator